MRHQLRRGMTEAFFTRLHGSKCFRNDPPHPGLLLSFRSPSLRHFHTSLTARRCQSNDLQNYLPKQNTHTHTQKRTAGFRVSFVLTGEISNWMRLLDQICPTKATFPAQEPFRETRGLNKHLLLTC